jgi:hypothetical protein
MKRIITLLFLVLSGYSVVWGQDVISLKSGGELKAHIIKLNPQDVIFVPENSFDTASILRNEISRLQYSSGIVIYLEEEETHVFTYELQNDSLYNIGKIDATRYYKGYKPAAIATMISSLYFPIGLIPAIACSATPPSMKNLGYKDPKLMENPSYYDGYTKTAHSIKKKKVWGGFAIGSGFVILFAIVISGVMVTAY